METDSKYIFRYSTNAKKLSAMLSDQVARKPYSALRYSLKLATSPKPSLFTLKSQHLSFLEFHNLDIFSIVLLTAFIVCF